MRRVVMIEVMLAGVLVAGCGQTALQRAKVVALTAKQTAETAYLTVRIGWELGHVDQATKDRARALYAQFEMVQTAYVNALELWQNGAPQSNLDTLRDQVTAMAAALHALALEAKSESPPTTTRPVEASDGRGRRAPVGLVA
jgi:hypothetical protein